MINNDKFLFLNNINQHREFVIHVTDFYYCIINMCINNL